MTQRYHLDSEREKTFQSLQFWELFTKKKREEETILSMVHPSDELTESIEYDKEKLLVSLGVQQALTYHEFIQNAYKDNLSVLIQEIKELKQFITQQSEKQPTIVCTKIYSLPSEQYQLKIPLDVTLEIHSDEVLAILPDLELYGEGENQIEAINDLKLELLDLCEDLEEVADEELGEFPKSWKKTIE